MINSTILSICIPTNNRSESLTYLLDSIKQNEDLNKLKNYFEVCVSDNSQNNLTRNIVSKYKDCLSIKYFQNSKNIGRTKNYLNVVELATSEFVWLVGDDDILQTNAIKNIINYLVKFNHMNFFFVNAVNLKKEEIFFIEKFKNDISRRVSKIKKNKILKFFDLINPQFTKDFLGGMYLYIFKKKYWDDKKNILSKESLDSTIEFSHFDNTFPHVKIISEAFYKNEIYYISEPYLICVSGYREWSSLSPLVTSFRTLEILNNYRRLGLPFYQFIKCKNYAYRFFIPDIFRIVLKPSNFNFKEKFIYKNILESFFYPYTYFSIFKYIYDKFNSYFKP